MRTVASHRRFGVTRRGGKLRYRRFSTNHILIQVRMPLPVHMTQTLIYARHGHLLQSLSPFQTEGLELVADSWAGVTGMMVVAAVRRDVERSGWHVSSRQGFIVRIEPNVTSLVQPPRFLFHAAPRTTRASISRTGLQTSVGRRTQLRRSHPPRVYLALTLADAFAFILNQTSGRPGYTPSRTAADYDVWRVTPSRSTTYHRDLRFAGQGVWCAHPIGPRRLLRLPTC